MDNKDGRDPPNSAFVGLEKGCFVIRPTGEVSQSDLAELARHAAENPALDDVVPIMWDMTHAELGNLGELSDLAQRVQAQLRNQRTGRTAFVMNSAAAANISRAVASWSSITSNRQFRVFQSDEIDFAREWLTALWTR